MMSVNGLVVMTPTSIASTGTGNSSSIGANGKVTFSSCETLSLNGVFTSSYDNYMVSLNVKNTTGTNGFVTYYRLRASGTDNSTASSYVYQSLYADSTAVGASRATSNLGTFDDGGSGNRTGSTTFIFAPYLAQPTAWRSVAASGYASGMIYDRAGTHNQSTAYDGFSIFWTFGGSPVKSDGVITVYGFNQ